jgi:hypothetical protein
VTGEVPCSGNCGNQIRMAYLGAFITAIIRTSQKESCTIPEIRTSQKESCTRNNALSKIMHSCFLLENLLGTFNH